MKNHWLNNRVLVVNVCEADMLIWIADGNDEWYEARKKWQNTTLDYCFRHHSREELLNDMETAWGLMANAYRGDWSLASSEWRKHAEHWRDEAWHQVAHGIYQSRQ